MYSKGHIKTHFRICGGHRVNDVMQGHNLLLSSAHALEEVIGSIGAHGFIDLALRHL